ncbi:MAG: class I SAM-dependent methyltransferase [Bacteroidetes bacterium]|nr:class I SAM-dependent methyltransferase [Bacteroidota bacterium]
MTPDLAFVEYLYTKYRYEIQGMHAIQKQRISQLDFKPHFDDMESELLYMLVREFAPSFSIEFSPYFGYSTTWILAALRKNNNGLLKSFDIVDFSYPKVKASGLADRWEFVLGDVTQNYPIFEYADIDFVFIDSDHTREFANRYCREFLAPLHEQAIKSCKIIPVMTHDIYSWETKEVPTEEGEEVLNFLKERDIPYFTASCFYENFPKLKEIRGKLGITSSVHAVEGNPSIMYFLGVR